MDLTPAITPGADAGPAAPSADPGPKIVRLHPIRTLTVAHDLAFRQRALIVLRELGTAAFCVPAFDRPEDAVELVLEERPDVLLLDISISRVPLAYIANALQEQAPRVGIVAVANREAPSVAGVRILAKWGWASDLRTAVEDAYHRGNAIAAPEAHLGRG